MKKVGAGKVGVFEGQRGGEGVRKEVKGTLRVLWVPGANSAARGL